MWLLDAVSTSEVGVPRSSELPTKTAICREKKLFVPLNNSRQRVRYMMQFVEKAVESAPLDQAHQRLDMSDVNKTNT